MVWSWACHGETSGFEGDTVLYGSKGSIKGGKYTLDDGTSGDLVERFRAEVGQEQLDRLFPAGVHDEFALNQYDFVRKLEDPSHEMETTGREGLADLAASFAILESSQARRTVTMDEVLTGKLDAYQQPINKHYDLS
jgi:hypothetical protein